MNITEFASSRHVEPQAVSKYIYRHEEFNGLVSKIGKDVILSDKAVLLLDEKYPLPKPVEVIVDHKSRDELIIAQREIIRLQQELNGQTKLLAEAKYNQLLLEKKDEELEKLNERVSAQESILEEKEDLIQAQQERLLSAEEEKDQLRAQIEELRTNLKEEHERAEKMQNTGLFGRIFKSWNKQ